MVSKKHKRKNNLHHLVRRDEISIEDAQHAIRLGHYKEAINICSRIIEKNSGNKSAYYYRGISHGCANNYTYAISDMNSTLEIDPHIKKAHIHLFVLYCKENLYICAKRALEHMVKNPDVHHMLRILKKEGELCGDEKKDMLKLCETILSNPAMLDMEHEFE